jgi:Recombination endonuclease VII
MQGQVPEVRIVGGRVVTAPGTGPMPMIWLPLNGQVVAKIPAVRGNRRWVHKTVGVRSPRFAGDRWYLPRSCLTRLVIAATDRFGWVVVSRDMSRLSRCNRACLEATGVDCDCSCMGEHHGQDSGNWFVRAGEVMVADLGEIKRTALVYVPAGSDTESVLYGGELSGRRYSADRAGRRDWPRASQFMCACCMTTQARVWDHCHVHGLVRAPLCNLCNTREWTGWRPQDGRAAPSSNLDTSYYRWCPWYSVEAAAPCTP